MKCIIKNLIQKLYFRYFDRVTECQHKRPIFVFRLKNNSGAHWNNLGESFSMNHIGEGDYEVFLVPSEPEKLLCDLFEKAKEDYGTSNGNNQQ